MVRNTHPAQVKQSNKITDFSFKHILFFFQKTVLVVAVSLDLTFDSKGDSESSAVLSSLALPSFAMADEEPVDQKKDFEESCKPKCVKPLLAYQACVKRIQGDESGHKHCTGQYFDYWSCVDKCVAPKLFAKLK